MESDMSFKCSSQDPLVTFGVLADVQYADHDDKPARYDPSLMRYYRNALNQVSTALIDRYLGHIHLPYRESLPR
ncbi:hypothetical protein IscW_ISCW012264 [Ixodes scapularis]|uniref:Uncharacterized protein n=1 Tax=Ixodes scapularis TaxID=6945 RepID=B7QDS5_IXOSC|nr:hypothetical protein IscW_ISCW012264 [Ixodes scapularis]|eukprot:XP_002413689.1 hypothetical protein IscW_ISCW012264 [Ixodes scapularis]